MGLIYLHKKLARYLVDPSGIFIMNFLITNLLLVVLLVPFSASSSFFGRWIFGDFGCQMYAGLGFILGLASIFSAQLLVFDFYMHTIKCDYSVRYFKLTSRNRGALNIKLICIQWVISMLLTVPPMFALLGRMHQEPSGTMCTIDYWHGNFKNYRLYVVMLMAVTGTLIISMLTLYFKCLKALKDYDVSTSILSDVLLNHILGMAKLSGLGFVVITFAWGPVTLLCFYSLLAGAKDLNIYMTMIPPIMAKFAPLMNSTAVIFTMPRISAAFHWWKNSQTIFNVSDEITNVPKPLWTSPVMPKNDC